MSVSYDTLWVRLKDLGMSKKELMAATHIAPATVAMLTHNRTVSMDTLISICKVLRCDIGDIVHISTQEQIVDQAIPEYIKEMNDPKIAKTAVELYLKKHKISKNEFVRITGISANTLQRIAQEKPCALSTYKKLFAVLSGEFIEVADRFAEGNGNQ